MLNRKQIVILSGSAIVLALALRYFEITPLVADGLFVFATVLAGDPIARKAIQLVRFKVVGIEALVTGAVTGALFIGEFWEAAAVTFLFIFGSYLEERSLEKTRSSLQNLLALSPTEARVIRDGVEQNISPSEVVKGENVFIRPGEKIPIDGTVVAGHASVNQAAITGESEPVRCEPGDDVYSGTVLETGYLEVQAEQVGEDTTFARIVQMVEEAQETKASSQRFLERFSRYYTPAIMVLAVLVYFVTWDVRLTLTLLVISCPGALVISVPVSIVAGIGNAAKNGILIKGGDYLEKAGKVDVVAFDKTGTLTVGKPHVTGVRAYEGTEAHILALAAGAETHSEHHLARAIITKARDELEDSDIPAAKDFQVFPGQGVKAVLQGRHILLGNRTLMKNNGVAISTAIEDDLQREERRRQTAVLLADESRGIIGRLSIADVVRDDAAHIVQQLKREGIAKVVMLTGDNQRTADAVAEQLGVTTVYADLMPEDKVRVIEQLQQRGKTVAMAGDGINDAPALATADLGIAMGVAGTDVAMETADVVLMTDNLRQIQYAFALSRAAVRNIRQNIVFSVSVVILLMLGVLFNKIFMASGMLIHELSVILVILNAIRLLRIKPEQKRLKPSSKVKAERMLNVGN
ncbi:heavy metal translocating P-type ATPase [Numidum massiliense]|uniref:heavy metal translocating P-type ATPase n=1 Tax=Numidum massiliense TaxID=1522315 RepID=UPI0006D564C6|nr:cation-translocating P-type ATPase [Numidum massiliense]